MALTLIQNEGFVSTGLQTYTFTIPTGTAGLYTVSFQASEFPPSSLAVVVKNGVTTKFTAATIGQTQSAMQFKFTLPCADADVITVVMTSAAANDNLMNTVKSICSIANGAN